MKYLYYLHSAWMVEIFSPKEWKLSVNWPQADSAWMVQIYSSEEWKYSLNWPPGRFCLIGLFLLWRVKTFTQSARGGLCLNGLNTFTRKVKFLLSWPLGRFCLNGLLLLLNWYRVEIVCLDYYVVSGLFLLWNVKKKVKSRKYVSKYYTFFGLFLL